MKLFKGLEQRRLNITMKFIRSEELKRGMRLGRPIYNKSGVMLYDINTKLTKQGVNSIQNFGLLGVYILEPTEPMQEIKNEDREFERFQTMSVLTLKEQLEMIINHEGAKKIEQLSTRIINNYGKMNNKINFLKTLRSPEDYVYKHSLNVAILSAIISAQLNMSYMEQINIVTAALLHEIGKAMIPVEILKKGAKLSEEDAYVVSKSEIDGNELIQQDYDIPSLTRIMIAQNMKEISGKKKPEAKILDGTKVLRVADVYDSMTSMGLAGEPYSDVAAIRYLIKNQDSFDEKVVGALLRGINILNPGVCVELTSGERGLVIRENQNDILRPIILGFHNNKIYDLEDSNIYDSIQIYDVLKSMDTRVPIRKDTIEKFGI